ncbi:MAG: peptidoglycan-binding protein [Desulfobacterales bacterium]|nr:peptidoglycan-binding protein [Desulfobacterales bacterium]
MPIGCGNGCGCQATCSKLRGSEGADPDLELFEGLRRFQARHGLEADGRMGPQTLQALNVSLAGTHPPDRVEHGAMALAPARSGVAPHPGQRAGSSIWRSSRTGRP